MLLVHIVYVRAHRMLLQGVWCLLCVGDMGTQVFAVTVLIFFYASLVLVFDNGSDGYYPILYINDYWNLAQDYMPINDTTR